MTFFLAAQHTYDGIQIGLFNGPKLIQTLFCEKKNASKKIVSLVDQLLRDHKVSFDDLLFVAANQGPGPFTSLRVVIASMNGIAFATKKSMIGIFPACCPPEYHLIPKKRKELRRKLSGKFPPIQIFSSGGAQPCSGSPSCYVILFHPEN